MTEEVTIPVSRYYELLCKEQKLDHAAYWLNVDVANYQDADRLERVAYWINAKFTDWDCSPQKDTLQEVNE